MCFRIWKAHLWFISTHASLQLTHTAVSWLSATVGLLLCVCICTHTTQRTEDSLCWYYFFDVDLVCQGPLYKTKIRKRSWKDHSCPDFLSRFYKWGLISWSALSCLGHVPISTAAWSPSLWLPRRPRSQRGQKVKWKGWRGKDRQWMMERLTEVETVGREAERETTSVKLITWNKSNGFSSLKTDWTFNKKKVSSSLKLF